MPFPPNSYDDLIYRPAIDGPPTRDIMPLPAGYDPWNDMQLLAQAQAAGGGGGGVAPLDIASMLPPPPQQQAAPPQQSGKGNKKGLSINLALAALMPLAAKRGGPTAVAGLLHGIQRAQAESQAQQQQQFQNNRLTQGDQRAQEALDQTRWNQQQTVAGSILREASGALAGVESPDAVGPLLALYKQRLANAGFMDTGVLDRYAQSIAAPDKILRRKVEKVIAKVKPEVLDAYVQSRASLKTDDGQVIPFDVWSQHLASGVDPQTGKPIITVAPPPKPDIPNTPEEQFYQRFAVEHGAKTFGELPTSVQAQARKTWMQADDVARTSNGPRDRFSVQPTINPDGTTGLVRINLDTGEVSPVSLPNGSGSGRGSDTERLSKAYLDRTTASDKTAAGFEDSLIGLGRQFDVQLPNLLKSAKGQQYKQAEDEFINAALRRESGAAIQPSEYDRFERIYFVRPGDTRQTIQQKRAARRRVIDGFRVAAGNMGGQSPAMPQGAPGPNPFRH